MSESRNRIYTILFVDDERVLSGLMEQFIESHSDSDVFELHVVADGDSALNFIQDKNNKIDMLITDVSHPGLRGDDLVKMVREHYPQIKIIVQTGYDDAEVRNFYSQFADTLLIKPYKTRQLIAEIRKLLNAD